MNTLPEVLLTKIHSYSNVKEQVNNLLLDKMSHIVLTSTLNEKWPIDAMRIKLIFCLWYKKTRPRVRLNSNTRGYSNSWTRPTYDPSDRIILLR